MQADATFQWRRLNCTPEGEPLVPAVRALAVSPAGRLAVGTQGQGLLVRDPGANGRWRRWTKESGLPWRHVSALAFSGEKLWIGTAGGALALLEGLNDREPEIRTISQGDRVHRYVSAISATERAIWVATTDGLLRFDPGGELEDQFGDAHLENVYATALRTGGPILIVGHLAGGSVSYDEGETWHPLMPRLPEDPKRRRVRDIRLLHRQWLLATDGGVGWSNDSGSSWHFFEKGPGTLPARHFSSWPASSLAVATPDGIVRFSEIGTGLTEKTKAELISNAAWEPASDAHALLRPDDVQLIGTSAGLFEYAERKPQKSWEEPQEIRLEKPEPWPFLSLRRPIDRTQQPYLDQTYLFATTCEGEFRPHRGVEFNAPPGTPIVACAAGQVVRVTAPEDGNRVFIDHGEVIPGWIMTTVYVHGRALYVREGMEVKAGKHIADAGAVGRATNSHLHFEVEWRRTGESLDLAKPSNPELWLEPAEPGFGALALRSPRGQRLPSATVRGPVKPFPFCTPFLEAQTPDESLQNDTPGSGWLVIGDLPAGRHVLRWRDEARDDLFVMEVEAGRLSLGTMAEPSGA
ncbi:M23 family metallopeptidase [bacterium]|nr:M23 family metallopeptidase [bacterium]